MSDQEKIREAVASIAHVPVSGVEEGSRITEDLGLRSIQRVELAALLESELGKRVEDVTVNRAKTVRDLFDALAPRP
jgi:acyl carrier protein